MAKSYVRALDHPYIIGLLFGLVGGILLWHVVDVLTAVHNHTSYPYQPLSSGAGSICIMALSVGLTLLLGGSRAAN
jgi:hypothetical protein